MGGGIRLVVRSVRNWMSDLKCLEDLEPGCAAMSIYKSSNNRDRPENGSQSQG